MATATQTPPKPKTAVPSFNPYICLLALCPTCGQIILPTLTRLQDGKVTGLVYYHSNPEYGCAYKVEEPGDRIRGMISGLKTSVRQGVDENHQPKFVSEFDLSADTSFSLEGLKPVSVDFTVPEIMAEDGDVIAPVYPTPGLGDSTAPKPKLDFSKAAAAAKKSGAKKPTHVQPAEESHEDGA